LVSFEILSINELTLSVRSCPFLSKTPSVINVAILVPTFLAGVSNKGSKSS
jgi:hypothetical protein